MSARPELAIACGAAGGAWRTGIVSSVLKLRVGVTCSSEAERAVENRHHLERGRFPRPTTCAAGIEERKIEPFVLV